MDDNRARELLAAQRAEAERLLASVDRSGRENREAEDEEAADYADAAQPLTEQGLDDALAESLRIRLAAIGRAEERLAAGTYGRSVASGEPIPDGRLEADPAAELTVTEAEAQSR